jgi:hypothetical protein
MVLFLLNACFTVQTLGHLGQMLQWPRYLHLRDTSEVLLADCAETYAMLAKMITSATRPFRSKKIHLGMDETHGLGHGRYRSIFGQQHDKEPTRIFIDHLCRVNKICADLGLRPCIWRWVIQDPDETSDTGSSISPHSIFSSTATCSSA